MLGSMRPGVDGPAHRMLPSSPAARYRSTVARSRSSISVPFYRCAKAPRGFQLAREGAGRVDVLGCPRMRPAMIVLGGQTGDDRAAPPVPALTEVPIEVGVRMDPGPGAWIGRIDFRHLSAPIKATFPRSTTSSVSASGTVTFIPVDAMLWSPGRLGIESGPDPKYPCATLMNKWYLPGRISGIVKEPSGPTLKSYESAYPRTSSRFWQDSQSRCRS